MNKHLLFLFIGLFFTKSILFAQTPFNTLDSISINKIHACAGVHGDMWSNMVGRESRPGCFFNDGLRKQMNGWSGLWISGYDDAHAIHIAAETYRYMYIDYWPGPLPTGGSITYSASSDWAKIWKINKSTIDTFLTLTSHTISSTPASILSWPGKGNMFATGNGGVALSVTSDMAPFVDLNGDGIYEPLLGEFPDIKGDQALWWVINDNGPTHDNSNGRPLGVEIHNMAYGWSRGTDVDNVVYYEYDLLNKSLNNYSNFRFSNWIDVDLGYYYDDFIGCDTSLRLGYQYNGTDDDGAGAGHPVGSYNQPELMSGVSFVYLPGDSAGYNVPLGSFTYYNNDYSRIGNPKVDTEFNNYMRGLTRFGDHYRYDFAGSGIPSTGIGAGPTTNYLFTGNPSDTTSWNECTCGNLPGDRRFIISSNNFNLNVGEKKKVVMALIVVDSAGGCPNLNFNKILPIADTAHSAYRKAAGTHPVIPPNTTIPPYPNPAHDIISIETAGHLINEESISVYNVIGQKVPTGITQNQYNYQLKINHLASGMYYLVYMDGGKMINTRFIKE